MEKRLTTRDINKLVASKAYGKHCDGGNLYLQGSEEYGTWSWLFRFKSPETGKERWMGVGSLETFSLAEARDEARKHRQTLARGADPINQRLRNRKDARDNTLKGIPFKEACEKYMQQHFKRLRSEKHKDQWRDSVQGLYREIGAFPAISLGESDINAALAPVAARAPVTATRTAGRVLAVIKWVRAGMPPLVKVERNHHAAMPFEQIPAFMTQLRCKPGITARALELTVLTAARTSQTIGATWDEIKGDLWIVPPDRVGAKGKTHIVPLSKAAQELLAALPRVNGNPYIFPGTKERERGHINERGMIELLQSMDGCSGYTIHGMRTAFRDWAGDETEVEFEVAEHALNHAVGDRTVRSYRRRTAVKKRAALMEEWANYCGAPAKTGNVVALRHA